MHSDSLTLPFPSARWPRPESSESPTEHTPSAIHRLLQVPLRLLSSGRGEVQPAGTSRRRIERRLSVIARHGQWIAFGTAELPYRPLDPGGTQLAALRRLDGLAITVTTRSSEILEQLDLLIELDRSHTVTVDLLVACPGAWCETQTADLAESLRTVSALSSNGITIRLVLTDLPRLPLSRNGKAGIRQLFETARAHRAFDVAAAFGHGPETEDWRRIFRRLRLELGFPRVVPGRG